MHRSAKPLSLGPSHVLVGRDDLGADIFVVAEVVALVDVQGSRCEKLRGARGRSRAISPLRAM
jgi:hypothetical protein